MMSENHGSRTQRPLRGREVAENLFRADCLCDLLSVRATFRQTTMPLEHQPIWWGGTAETVSKLSKNEDSMLFEDVAAMDRSEKIVSRRVFERMFFSPPSFETVSAWPAVARKRQTRSVVDAVC